MRLRRLAIRAASGSPIGRPNASTPAVERLKPRRQHPRDAQRTFPRLPGPNPRASACGRALGTSGSLWRAACPSKRAAPQWDGDSAQTSPARLSALRRFAPRAAFKPAHRRIFGESAQASVRDSPRREVAPQALPGQTSARSAPQRRLRDRGGESAPGGENPACAPRLSGSPRSASDRGLRRGALPQVRVECRG